MYFIFFFFNDTATTEIYTLSLHDALPISVVPPTWRPDLTGRAELIEEVLRLEGYDTIPVVLPTAPAGRGLTAEQRLRSEEHTSELQSRQYLVCRLLLEKKKK